MNQIRITLFLESIDFTIETIYFKYDEHWK